jgi:hypothetical protein
LPNSWTICLPWTYSRHNFWFVLFWRRLLWNWWLQSKHLYLCNERNLPFFLVFWLAQIGHFFISYLTFTINYKLCRYFTENTVKSPIFNLTNFNLSQIYNNTNCNIANQLIPIILIF